MVGVHPRNLSTDTKIFTQGRQKFTRAWKNKFPCELFCLHFKCKNNKKRKRFWVRQVAMKRHLRWEFHVLIKEVKLFNTSSSSSTLLIDILIFHSDVSQCLFCSLIGSIWQFQWPIILSNNFFRFRVKFFQSQNGKINSSTRKTNYCVLSRCACAKLKIFLSAKKFLKLTPAFRLRNCKKSAVKHSIERHILLNFVILSTNVCQRLPKETHFHFKLSPLPLDFCRF